MSGTVHTIDGSTIRSFSGTLELMRVFEDLVPVDAARPPTSIPGSPIDPPTNAPPPRWE